MFYKCKKCGAVITEFDVNFSNNLLGKFETENCMCAECLGNVSKLKSSKINKPKIYKYFAPYLLLFLYIYLAFKFDMPFGPLLTLLGCAGILHNLWLYTIILDIIAISYIVFVSLCIKDFSLTDDSYVTTDNVLVTTYDDSKDAFVTKQSYTQHGATRFDKQLGLFFVYPFWGVFVYFHRLKKMKIITAYNTAINNTETFTITEKAKKDFKKLNKLYKEKQDNTQVPCIKIHSSKKTYNLLFIFQAPYLLLADEKNNCKIIQNNLSLPIANEEKLKQIKKLYDDSLNDTSQEKILYTFLSPKK